MKPAVRNYFLNGAELLDTKKRVPVFSPPPTYLQLCSGVTDGPLLLTVSVFVHFFLVCVCYSPCLLRGQQSRPCHRESHVCVASFQMPPIYNTSKYKIGTNKYNHIKYVHRILFSWLKMYVRMEHVSELVYFKSELYPTPSASIFNPIKPLEELLYGVLLGEFYLLYWMLYEIFLVEFVKFTTWLNFCLFFNLESEALLRSGDRGDVKRFGNFQFY